MVLGLSFIGIAVEWNGDGKDRMVSPTAFDPLHEILDGVAAAPLQLLPSSCPNPTWANARLPWHLTVMHAPVRNRGVKNYSTGCDTGCGHRGVGPSIHRGLILLGVANVDWQPTYDDRISDVVYVQADVTALKQALQWKAEKKVQVVIGGPNLIVDCLLDDPVMANPLLDVFIVPCAWVALGVASRCPWLRSKLRVIANGVDVDFWQPSVPRLNRTRALIYDKLGGTAFSLEVERVARESGYDVDKITYGRYTQHQKREALDNAAFMIHLTHTESQSLAALEAWSMDVPTITWARFGVIYNHSTWLVTSPSPYLSPSTGLFFSTLQELALLLEHWASWRSTAPVQPRRWVLKHLTDTVAVKNLLTMINCEWMRIQRGVTHLRE